LLFSVNGITLQAIVCNVEENVSALSAEVKLISFFVRSIEQSLVNVSLKSPKRKKDDGNCRTILSILSLVTVIFGGRYRDQIVDVRSPAQL
jgi:hypothetical protein